MIALARPGRTPGLESQLAAESEIVGQLLAVLLEERQALESGSPDALEAVVVQKNRLIDRLSNKRRGSNAGSFVEIPVPTSDPATRSGGVASTTATNTPGSSWKALHARYAEAARLNQDNGLFASRQMAYLRIRNTGLHRAAGTSNFASDLYRSDGMASRGTAFATQRPA